TLFRSCTPLSRSGVQRGYLFRLGTRLRVGSVSCQLAVLIDRLTINRSFMVETPGGCPIRRFPTAPQRHVEERLWSGIGMAPSLPRERILREPDGSHREMRCQSRCQEVRVSNCAEWPPAARSSFPRF